MSDKKNTKKKICIACGGSAGHIFPGLTLAEELKKRYGPDAEVSFLTSDNELAQSLFKVSGFDFRALPLHRKGSALSFILSLLRGALESARIIFSNRPDCFVGFGSYVAGPPFVVASLLGVPTLIHEQNTVTGKANRIMRHFATRVALSFPEASGESKNIVITGNPIRKSAAEIRDKTSAIDSLGLSRAKFTILVIGGSQGSRTVNSMASEAFRNMKNQLCDRIQIIHIAGQNDYDRLRKIYRDTDILYKLYPFFKDMGIVYSAADISISRAGASVIGELCLHRIPSILIPYPFAEGHQVQNAKYLAERDAAIIIEEDRLSKTSLLEGIKTLMKKDELRESMRRKMGALTVFDAAKKLADEVDSLL